MSSCGPAPLTSGLHSVQRSAQLLYQRGDEVDKTEWSVALGILEDWAWEAGPERDRGWPVRVSEGIRRDLERGPQSRWRDGDWL